MKASYGESCTELLDKGIQSRSKKGRLDCYIVKDGNFLQLSGTGCDLGIRVLLLQAVVCGLIQGGGGQDFHPADTLHLHETDKVGHNNFYGE
jgi:hypothetical protein